MPVTLVPLRWPLRCFRSSQLKSSAPRSSASLTLALVTRRRTPSSFAGPYSAVPLGALIRRNSTWSMPSWRAAFDMIGSNSAIACTPPGPRCDVRGGVFVMTVRPRNRMLTGW